MMNPKKQTQSKTGFLQSKLDQTPIFYRHYANPQKKASVILLHGYGEHSGRYLHVIDFLRKNGFEIFCIDLRGHGYSKGNRGFVNRFSDYTYDLESAVDMAQSYNSGEKIFLIAHSMGALVTLYYLRRFPKLLDGVAFSAPLMGLNLKIAWWKYFGAKIFSGLFPNAIVKTKLRGHLLSHDKEIVDQYHNDPLVLHHTTLRWFNETNKAIVNLKKFDQKIETPFFVQVAEADMVVNSEACLDWFRQNQGKIVDAELKIYDGFFHEIYNETEREKPLLDLLRWFNEKL